MDWRFLCCDTNQLTWTSSTSYYFFDCFNLCSCFCRMIKKVPWFLKCSLSRAQLPMVTLCQTLASIYMYTYKFVLQMARGFDKIVWIKQVGPDTREGAMKCAQVQFEVSSLNAIKYTHYWITCDYHLKIYRFSLCSQFDQHKRHQNFDISKRTLCVILCTQTPGITLHSFLWMSNV